MLVTGLDLVAAACAVAIVHAGLLYGWIMAEMRAARAERRACMAVASLDAALAGRVFVSDFDFDAHVATGPAALVMPARGRFDGECDTVELVRFREPTPGELLSWQSGGLES